MALISKGANGTLRKSGFHQALQSDLEDAKEVHKAFFPEEDLFIPGLTCETLLQTPSVHRWRLLRSYCLAERLLGNRDR